MSATHHGGYMDEAVLSAAVAGLARGLGDFWPAGLPAAGLSSSLLDKAERCVRGAEAKAGMPAALLSIYNALSLNGAPKPDASNMVPLAQLKLAHDTLLSLIHIS